MRNLLFIALILLTTACSRRFTPQQYEPATTEINADVGEAGEITALIAPYKDGLEAEMNTVIGEFAHDMYKKRPEGELGNFMCDAVLNVVQGNGGMDAAQICFMNYGGIRVQHIPAGEITVENMFSLMPFENEVVILKMTGDPLREFLEKTARSGGWPVSKGFEMVIKDQQIQSMALNGEPIDYSKTYTIALSDYVANGGDGMAMLKELPRENTGVKVRDMLLQYCRWKQRSAEPITAEVSGRVIVQE